MNTTIKMEEFLNVDHNKINKIVNIKLEFLKDRLSLAEAKDKMNSSFEQVTAQEFAICEQYLQKHGITDDVLAKRMEEILEIFEDVLVSGKLDLPLGHPIRTYLDETDAIKVLLKQMESLLKKKFIKNQWLEIYEKLSQITIHFSRKQNQLFAALERKGFDKPSKVMWTLDNNIKESLRKAQTYLGESKDDAFIRLQDEVIKMIKDMLVKEIEILFPTAIELLSDQEFIEMRIGDDEIGYCLIDTPQPYGPSKCKGEALNANNELLKDLTQVLSKHGILNDKSNNDVLDVSQGKLTLEQINLIFKHLQVDLSYVDENEIVKFYSDTKHRVFPRSAGVIGRKVQNCHPRESVDTVEKVIEAFRSGKQDKAEFWLEMGGKFIYIIYNAVRDDKGNFRGVLEMMQDVTHIRGLQGNQRLVSWDEKDDNENNTLKDSSESNESVNEEVVNNAYGFNKETILNDIVKKYPFIKDFLVGISPKFNKLKNPILFKTMSSVATLKMISERGEMDTQDLIDQIISQIELTNKK